VGGGGGGALCVHHHHVKHIGTLSSQTSVEDDPVMRLYIGGSY